ncbi:hypothetical protein [Xylanimonas sp. McL0601]|uniref:hypothetical protein n=1 Tax=Xylanimonas sp. McL0601 TaxID=3414739 RepID=UPI003CF8AF20
MHEQILGTVPEIEEAEPSVGVEPSDSSLGHPKLLISADNAVTHCPPDRTADEWVTRKSRALRQAAAFLRATWLPGDTWLDQ